MQAQTQVQNHRNTHAEPWAPAKVCNTFCVGPATGNKASPKRSLLPPSFSAMLLPPPALLLCNCVCVFTSRVCECVLWVLLLDRLHFVCLGHAREILVHINGWASLQAVEPCETTGDNNNSEDVGNYLSYGGNNSNSNRGNCDKRMLMHAHNIIMLGLAHFLRRLCLEKLTYNNKNKRNTRLGKPDGFKAPTRRVQSDGRNYWWHARRQHTLQIVGVLKDTL